MHQSVDYSSSKVIVRTLLTTILQDTPSCDSCPLFIECTARNVPSAASVTAKVGRDDLQAVSYVVTATLVVKEGGRGASKVR